MLVRSFFSLFGEVDKASADEASTSAKLKREEEEERQQTERLMLEERTNYRMSMQHGHPLGPWRAMLAAVQSHHDNWVLALAAAEETLRRGGSSSSGAATINPEVEPPPVFRVLDLACGPRGEPGTTIARALPYASVSCTDSCADAVASVLTVSASAAAVAAASAAANANSAAAFKSRCDFPQPPPPPANLKKAVVDLTDLSSFDSNTYDVITCCYGYGLSSDLPRALSEAHRVLVPGGILVVATWQSSAMLSSGRDVLATVRGMGRDARAPEDDDAFLPPRIAPAPAIALSGPGEFEALLAGAGFDRPGDIVTALGTYPFDLGRRSDDQFAMGTILVRAELERLGALEPTAGGWKNLAEEVFWINVPRYVDVVDGNMLLRDNTFKLTVSTKKP